MGQAARSIADASASANDNTALPKDDLWRRVIIGMTAVCDEAGIAAWTYYREGSTVGEFAEDVIRVCGRGR